MVYQDEIGENGSPHIQGFKIFEGKKCLASVTKLLPGCYLNRVGKEKSDLDVSINYCQNDSTRKPDTEPVVLGRQVSNGQREDFEKYKQDCNKGLPWSVLREAHPEICGRLRNWALEIFNARRPKPMPQLEGEFNSRPWLRLPVAVRF